MRALPVFAAFALLAGGLLPGASSAQEERRALLAVFAHPDDERIVAPMLARYARAAYPVHWVVATDGSQGVREHAGVPAGPRLAGVRADEARCAARALGIAPPTLLGLPDGGLASFEQLGLLRQELQRLVATLRPRAVVTVGPEGGTGHPDHRLVGNVVTEVVQGLEEGEAPALYFVSLPAERMRDAPAASPRYTPLPARHLTARVPFTPQDLDAARASFACHASQYTVPERDAIDRMLAHGFAGHVHLRPWSGGRETVSDILGQ